MTTAAERDRKIAAAEKRITKATTKAQALRAEADTYDALIARSRDEIAWWEQAPVTDASNNDGGDPTTYEASEPTEKD